MKNQTNNSNKVRCSNIELLRIISMMLIVATHLCNHYMDMDGSLWPFPPGFIFLQSVKSVTYIAVNMYVLISAYFLCTSRFNPNRSLEKASCHFLMTAIRKTALYMLDS